MFKAIAVISVSRATTLIYIYIYINLQATTLILYIYIYLDDMYVSRKVTMHALYIYCTQHMQLYTFVTIMTSNLNMDGFSSLRARATRKRSRLSTQLCQRPHQHSPAMVVRNSSLLRHLPGPGQAMCSARARMVLGTTSMPALQVVKRCSVGLQQRHRGVRRQQVPHSSPTPSPPLPHTF